MKNLGKNVWYADKIGSVFAAVYRDERDSNPDSEPYFFTHAIPSTSVGFEQVAFGDAEIIPEKEGRGEIELPSQKESSLLSKLTFWRN